ncbi:hypothetical protein Tco_0884784 [Tanacetum coccineum]
MFIGRYNLTYRIQTRGGASEMETTFKEKGVFAKKLALEEKGVSAEKVTFEEIFSEEHTPKGVGLRVADSHRDDDFTSLETFEGLPSSFEM